jgi:hypothetical protein
VVNWPSAFSRLLLFAKTRSPVDSCADFFRCRFY